MGIEPGFGKLGPTSHELLGGVAGIGLESGIECEHGLVPPLPVAAVATENAVAAVAAENAVVAVAVDVGVRGVGIADVDIDADETVLVGSHARIAPPARSRVFAFGTMFLLGSLQYPLLLLPQ